MIRWASTSCISRAMRSRSWLRPWATRSPCSASAREARWRRVQISSRREPRYMPQPIMALLVTRLMTTEIQTALQVEGREQGVGHGASEVEQADADDRNGAAEGRHRNGAERGRSGGEAGERAQAGNHGRDQDGRPPPEDHQDEGGETQDDLEPEDRAVVGPLLLRGLRPDQQTEGETDGQPPRVPGDRQLGTGLLGSRAHKGTIHGARLRAGQETAATPCSSTATCTRRVPVPSPVTRVAPNDHGWTGLAVTAAPLSGRSPSTDVTSDTADAADQACGRQAAG